MARRTKRLKPDEIARNERRLAEVNGWINEVDFDLWEPITNNSFAVIDGYLFGIFMKLRSTGYTICATNIDEIKRIEREQPAKPAAHALSSEEEKRV